MPKRRALLDMPYNDLPEVCPFYHVNINARLFKRVHTEMQKRGHTIQAAVEKMCRGYLHSTEETAE